LWNSAPIKYSVAILSIAALAVGCNSATETPVQSQVKALPTNPSDYSPLTVEHSRPASQFPLVGAWMGRAIINDQALTAAADSLSADQRQALIREARAFVTTEMAIEFSSTGEMETAIEMQPIGGQKVAGQTFGTWKILQSHATQVVVETIDTDQNGGISTSETTFAVSVDGDRLVLRPNVSSALAKCEALIYLDRQPASATRFAQAPEGPIVR
jgi:hypothetical protein